MIKDSVNRKYKSLSGRGGPPNPIDIHVGNRMMQQRRLLGWTQQDLGEKLGLTFQQIQKYERGLNRIAASRLYDVAGVLGVDILFFFQDMPDEIKAKSPSQLAGIKHDYGVKESGRSRYQSDPLQKKETLELVSNYYRVHDKKLRKMIFDLCKHLSKELIGRKPADNEAGHYERV